MPGGLGTFPPKARTEELLVPVPAKSRLAVFKFPPVIQEPTAIFAFHSSVAAVSDGVPPPATKPAVADPDGAAPHLFVLISLVSVQTDPFQDSVFGD